MSDISQIVGNTFEAEEVLRRAAQANAASQPANEQAVVDAAHRFEKVAVEASIRQETMMRHFSQELDNQVEKFITHFSSPQTTIAAPSPPRASTSSMGGVQNGLIEAVNNQTAAVLQLLAAFNAKNNVNNTTPTPPGA